MDQPHGFDDIEDLPRDVPPSTAPRTIGILNIIFGGLLLLCGVCSGSNLAMQSAFTPMMQGQNAGLEGALKQQRQDRINQLRQQEQLATNAQEKAKLKAQREALERAPLPELPKLTDLANDPTLRAWGLVEMSTGILLNVLMVVSGIGLVMYKEWARLTALGVAALKILRLLGVYAYFIGVLAPIITEKVVDYLDKFGKAVQQAGGAPGAPGAAGGPDISQMKGILGVIYTGYGVAMIVLGVIYPIIVLIVLTRPRCKAACAARPAQE